MGYGFGYTGRTNQARPGCPAWMRQGHSVGSIAQLIFLVLNVFSWALIGRALISWFDPGMNWPISQVLVNITEPVIAPIRRVIPPIGGMLDISFIVAIVLIQVLRNLLAQAFYG